MSQYVCKNLMHSTKLPISAQLYLLDKFSGPITLNPGYVLETKPLDYTKICRMECMEEICKIKENEYEVTYYQYHSQY